MPTGGKKREKISWPTVGANFQHLPKMEPLSKKKRSVKQNGKFPRYFPIQSFQVDDGKIYVQTFKLVRGKSEFYIFDLGGNLLRKVMVPFRGSELLCAYPFTIAQGKIYQLIENDDTEEWELHINKI
jgi:hypothetical protein